MTFMEGRPIGAYLYLPAEKRAAVARTEDREDLLIDFAEDGSPIGVEIIWFGPERPGRLNLLLEEIDVPPLTPEELQPLQVA